VGPEFSRKQSRPCSESGSPLSQAQLVAWQLFIRFCICDRASCPCKFFLLRTPLPRGLLLWHHLLLYHILWNRIESPLLTPTRRLTRSQSLRRTRCLTLHQHLTRFQPKYTSLRRRLKYCLNLLQHINDHPNHSLLFHQNPR
jgi:hypothetical protein